MYQSRELLSPIFAGLESQLTQGNITVKISYKHLRATTLSQKKRNNLKFFVLQKKKIKIFPNRN